MTIYDNAPNPQIEKLAFLFIILSISSRQKQTDFCAFMLAGAVSNVISCFFLSNLYHPAVLLAFPAPSNHPPPHLGQFLLQSNIFPGQIHSFLAQFLSTNEAPCDSVHLMNCFSSSTHVKNAFWPAKTAPFPTFYIQLCF